MAISLSNHRPTSSTSRLLTRGAVPPNTDHGSSAGCRSGPGSQLNPVAGTSGWPQAHSSRKQELLQWRRCGQVAAWISFALLAYAPSGIVPLVSFFVCIRGEPTIFWVVSPLSRAQLPPDPIQAAIIDLWNATKVMRNGEATENTHST